MLSDNQPPTATAHTRADDPRSGDQVILKADAARAAAVPAGAHHLVVADHYAGDGSGLYELTLPACHPRHEDWACVVTRHDMSRVRRTDAQEGTRTWRP
ncbi:DUF6211 family protein [Kitasatospora sp. NPDC057541]|uniref:DUF6211 family protein n=1 Tax=unclassified Kitasatospora TaxID=2633591 RepID=UPI0036CF79E6